MLSKFLSDILLSAYRASFNMYSSGLIVNKFFKLLFVSLNSLFRLQFWKIFLLCIEFQMDSFFFYPSKMWLYCPQIVVFLMRDLLSFLSLFYSMSCVCIYFFFYLLLWLSLWFGFFRTWSWCALVLLSLCLNDLVFDGLLRCVDL